VIGPLNSTRFDITPGNTDSALENHTIGFGVFLASRFERGETRGVQGRMLIVERQGIKGTGQKTPVVPFFFVFRDEQF
jgi:hypothetical protein